SKQVIHMKQKDKSANSINIKQYYEEKGYRSLNKSDLVNRFFSFAVDVIVMLAPIMIWDIIMMAVLGSIVSVSGIVIVNIIIGILLVCTILCLNAYIYTQTGGQSLGMRMFKYKVISKNGKNASKGKLILREVVGFDIPFVVLMIFFNAFGVVFYWGINALVLIVNKQQRTLVDFIFGTSVVGLMENVQVSKRSVEGTQVITPKKVVMENCRFDLHLHSNFSVNGEYNIEEIFQMAAKKNLKTISITDLDCAKQNSIAMRMSKLYHVNYVPGIEINCDLHGCRIRVLAYFIQYNNELFATIENESLVNEKNASIERVRKFEKLLGQRIDIDRLLKNNRFQKIPGELIAKHVLTRSEYEDCPLLQPYLMGSKKEQAVRNLVKDFFAYGKPCYVAVKYPLLEDVLDVIHLTEGVAVLAYPGKLLTNGEQLMNEAIGMGIEGIEVFHPAHSKKEMADLLQYAMKHKLFITGGSGFYNEDGGVQMGEFHCPKDAQRIIEEFIEAKA
ncbi:MAG: RDD family protein, partial [Longicatena sp.]